MRIAMITGGASGLGRAAAERLASDGLRVGVADLDFQRALEVVAGLPGEGHFPLQIDVAEEASVLAAFKTAECRHGPIAVLACFAGIASRDGPPRSVAFVDQDAKEWDQVMVANARGTFFCVREMLRRRAALRVVHGRVITVSSVAGQFGAMRSGAVFSASKGAVLSLTKVAAREAAAFDVTVHAIAPGPIASPILDRILRDDLASVAESMPMKRGRSVLSRFGRSWLCHWCHTLCQRWHPDAVKELR